MLVLEDLVGLHRTSQIDLFGISVWGIALDYCDTEWFALDTIGDHSVIFETVPKYYILQSFVHYEDNSIPCNRFLPTVIDSYIYRIKFVHFSSLIPKMSVFNLVIFFLTMFHLP